MNVDDLKKRLKEALYQRKQLDDSKCCDQIKKELQEVISRYSELKTKNHNL
jgi:septum formation topological specificity factor MinE